MLVICVLCAVGLAFVAAVFSAFIAPLFLLQHRHQQALDAAALKAASDLSQIVIDDPYWGYVALSDYPAMGHATIADDGQPVPVHGINTIIATCRLDYVIASELGNAQLEEMALEDLKHARESAKKLELCLKQSLAQDSVAGRDINGEVVHTFADAFETYSRCIGGMTKPRQSNFNLTLGWLNGPAATATRVSHSGKGASKNKYFPPELMIKGCYRACVDIPVGREHFSFAAIGTQPALANSTYFVPADEKMDHLGSIVRVEGACEARNIWDKRPQLVSGRSCGQPYQMEVKPAPAALLLSFPGGRPSSIRSAGDLLSDYNLRTAVMNAYTPQGNDFPSDESCQLQAQPQQVCAASSIAICFHDWLRSNYALPKVDSVLAALNTDLSTVGQSRSTSFVLAIDGNGNVIISPLKSRPFLGFAVAENQYYAIGVEPVAIGDRNSVVMCRDEVHKLGTAEGGKHAGQPWPGDPINWDELNSYVDGQFIPAAASRKAQGIRLAGEQRPDGGIITERAYLQHVDGLAPERQLRTAAYSTGLAAEISLSPPSTIRFW